MNTEIKPPVLIISYSRPAGVRDLIRASVSNGVSKVYVAVDGPKIGDNGHVQREIQQVVHSFSNEPHLNIQLLQHQKNLGVGVGVITAIDWFFSHEVFGHILEDDLKVDSGFFRFSREAHKQFTYNKKVFIISGTEINGNHTNSNSAHWCNYPMIWGWSTWADRWTTMRRGLLKKKDARIPIPSFARHNYWAVGANRVLEGKVDTWDTPLAAEFFSNKWLCLLPPVNLVSNIGNDKYASHTFEGSQGLNLPILRLGEDVDFYAEFTEIDMDCYNRKLEKEVFKIRRKHALLPIYSHLRDRHFYNRGIEPLNERLNSVSLQI